MKKLAILLVLLVLACGVLYQAYSTWFELRMESVLDRTEDLLVEEVKNEETCREITVLQKKADDLRPHAKRLAKLYSAIDPSGEIVPSWPAHSVGSAAVAMTWAHPYFCGSGRTGEKDYALYGIRGARRSLLGHEEKRGGKERVLSILFPEWLRYLCAIAGLSAFCHWALLRLGCDVDSALLGSVIYFALWAVAILTAARWGVTGAWMAACLLIGVGLLGLMATPNRPSKKEEE